MTTDSEARELHTLRLTAAVVAERNVSPRLRRFLPKQFAVLTTETLALLDSCLTEDYSVHVISLLKNNKGTPYPDDFVAGIFNALPQLDEDQLRHAVSITRDYFGALELYREGDVFYLQFVVKDYANYLQFPGVVDMPYLTDAERELFTLLHGKDEIIRSIRERKLSSKEVTVELVNEMSSMHSEFVEGVL
jgi:hypothetical protein